MSSRIVWSLLGVGSLCMAFSACKVQETVPFTESIVFAGGEEVSADDLNRGREDYILYCYACHGEAGDGAGPAAAQLRPAPRDFRSYTFKYGGVAEGELPHDEDLLALIKNGLHGTAMLPWEDVPDSTLRRIVNYIKTFPPEGEAWTEEDAELGTRILPENDPWAESESKDDAIKRGEVVYHGFTKCWSCHPAYIERKAISDASVATGQAAIGTFRPALYLPEIKASRYSVPLRGEEPTECEEDSDCEEGQICTFAVCEKQLNILPPDFEVNPIRMGNTVGEIYRTIAAGIPGTAMPQWKGSIPENEHLKGDADIWAVSYYVKHLIDRDTNPAVRSKLRDQLEASK